MSNIALNVESSADGLVARIPAIGRVSLFSQLPEVLTEGSVVGHVTTLRQTRTLVMPSGGPWLLRKVLVTSRGVGVGVATPILQLRNWDEADSGEDAAAAAEAGVFYATPMAGQYYRRPSPDQEPFIRVGDVIEPGTQIGLVEVMKFFYPLVFEGQGRWRVTELMTGESASLEAGDSVIRIEAVEG